jgi:exonuclease SbcD
MENQHSIGEFFADTHLGVRIRGTSLYRDENINVERQKDFLKNLEIVKKKAIENSCDFVLIGGDIFHNITPSGFLLDEFAKFISSLAKNDIKIVAIAGNHDQPRILGTESYIQALQDANAPNFYFFKNPEAMVLEGKSGKKVRFICLPYDFSIFQNLNAPKLVEELLKKLLSKKLGRFDFTIVLAHLYVDTRSVLGSESRIAMFRDVPIPKEIFEKDEIDLVCLGHLHTHQFISDKIVYSGSLERIDFKEENEKKKFILIKEEEKRLKAYPQELPTRPLITIAEDLTNQTNPTEYLASKLKTLEIPEGAIVRLQVKSHIEQILDKTKINDVLKDKKLLYWFWEHETKSKKESEINSTEEISRTELLKKFIETRFKGKVSDEILNCVINEALKIMENAERGEI